MRDRQAGQRRVAREAVEDRAVRGAVGQQDLDDLVVRVPVVDLQREAQLLGQRDVRAERLALHRAARPARRGSGRGRSPRSRGCAGWPAPSARRGRARRPGRPRAGSSGSSPSGATSRIPACRTASFGWMATAPSSCGWSRTTRSVHAIDVEVAAHLHHAGHADRRGALEVRGEVRRRTVGRRAALVAVPAVGPPRHHRVEVRVVVDDGDRQRLGRRGPAALPLRPGHQAWRNRSSSSSTIESSSLVNTGIGLATGVPGTTGSERHGATVRPSS